MKLIWADSAAADLENIFAFIAEDDLDTACQIDTFIRQSARRLLQFPYVGRKGRVKGTRELIIHPSYMLIYSVAANSIEIVSVLHTSRQYPSE